MNNDYLRVNSKSEQSDIATSEFKNEEDVSSKKATPKLNLITLLNFSRDKMKNGEITAENVPNLKGLIAILLIHATVTCMLAFISFLTSDVTVLLFTATVASLILPLFIILFFYNLNVTKTTNVTEMVTGIIIGICMFVMLNLLEVYLTEFIKYNWFKSMISVIIRDTALFLVANLFIKVAKKDNLFDAILLAITLYAGYMFMNSLSALTKSLFISVEINNGQTATVTSAIILSEASFKTVIMSFLHSFASDVLFSSLVISCFAVVNGGVIGLNVSPLKDKNYKEWSLYVLFIVTVILHLGAVFPSTVRLFSIILKTLSVVFSSVLAILIINYYLSKIHIQK